ncbi:hypothetical protein ABIC50_002512 [Burkholderia sp. 567]
MINPAVIFQRRARYDQTVFKLELLRRVFTNSGCR